MIKKKKSMSNKKIPKFKNEKEEIKFWSKHDSSEYFDWKKAVKNPVLPNLKMTSRSISLRLTEDMLDKLKIMANKADVPYQSYIKIILDREIKKERVKSKIGR